MRAIAERWAIAGLAVLSLGAAYVYFFTPWWPRLAAADGAWYGNWGAVVFAVGFYTLFIAAFLRPPRRREWRHLGISEAYIVALFAEMFGTPLTIYLLGSVLGAQFGLDGASGHLWAVLLDRAGLAPLDQSVAVIMAVSLTLIALGIGLTAAGWWQVWRARGALVTNGLYAYVRHPQYSGFLLVLVAFLIQWPTLITVLMFPVLIIAYVRLARREEDDLEREFGDDFRAWRARTGLLLPRLRGA